MDSVVKHSGKKHLNTDDSKQPRCGGEFAEKPSEVLTPKSARVQEVSSDG